MFPQKPKRRKRSPDGQSLSAGGGARLASLSRADGSSCSSCGAARAGTVPLPPWLRLHLGHLGGDHLPAAAGEAVPSVEPHRAKLAQWPTGLCWFPMWWSRAWEQRSASRVGKGRGRAAWWGRGESWARGSSPHNCLPRQPQRPHGVDVSLPHLEKSQAG